MKRMLLLLLLAGGVLALACAAWAVQGLRWTVTAPWGRGPRPVPAS